MRCRQAFMIGLAVFGAVAFPAHAAPSLIQEPRGITREIATMSGAVTDIDRVGRMITIQSGGVVQSPIYTGPDLPIFDQLSRGDVVTIRYYDAYIVEVTPTARMGPPENTTAAAQKQLDRPDAGVMQQTRLTVTIDVADATTGMVTYHGNDNRRVVRMVQDPKLIEGLTAGQVVTITHTRAYAAAIEKQ